MSGWNAALSSIRDTQIGTTGKKALVVEGTGDKVFFEAMLDKKARGAWDAEWCVGEANKKGHVREIIKEQPSWLGIVDCDEWSDTEAKAEIRKPEYGGRLHILPRYCMESYFITPDDIWSALPPLPKEHINKTIGEIAFRGEIAEATALDAWLRHGVLWHAVFPLWKGLRDLGFNKALLGDYKIAQDDALIKSKLEEWHDYIEPVKTMSNFHALLASAKSESLEQRLARWIHGKYYFRQHVTPVLNKCFPKQSADAEGWIRVLLKYRPLPPDLDPVWMAMGL